MYTTENYGIFLGLMTAKFGEEGRFVDNELKPFFARYKEKIKENLFSNGDKEKEEIFEQYLFRPKCYFLFDNFDLAVLSLVDDFNLGTRAFHPFNTLITNDLKESDNEYNSQNFTYKVISGTVPKFTQNSSERDGLLQTADRTFIGNNTERYPLIGITSLKFNNALLIGGGGSVMELAIKRVQELIKASPSQNGTLDYVIFHSASWHEITIVFFSNSYNCIADRVFAIREMVFDDLDAGEDKQAFNHINKNCLLQRYLATTIEKPNQSKIKAAHLFVHTHTVFGFDLEILRGHPLPQLMNNEGIQLHSRWNLKPGHTLDFIEGFREYFDQWQMPSSIISGRGDFSYTIEGNILENFLRIHKVISTNKNIRKHARKVVTTPQFKIDHDKGLRQKKKGGDHYLFHNKLPCFRFSLNNIADTRIHLEALGISKIIQEKIINMFIIFNDGMEDPVLYGYFIELKPYLEQIRALIEDLATLQNGDKSMAKTQEILLSAADLFESAYTNRFGQSYIMNEITDFNIEFNGGLQQLIAAYDGAYKSLTALMGEGVPGKSVTYASSYPIIESESLGVRLNYFHLYQPEFFAAAATHEAANFFGMRRATKDSEVGLLFQKLEETAERQGISSLERSTLNYFFTDIATLKLAYNEDFELFFYWHWCSFFQTSNVYKPGGKEIVHQHFEKFLARMVLVDQFMNPSESDRFFYKFPDPPFNACHEGIRQTWKASLQKAKDMAQKIIDDDQRKLASDKLLPNFANLVLGLEVEDFVKTADGNEVPKIYEKLKKLAEQKTYLKGGFKVEGQLKNVSDEAFMAKAIRNCRSACLYELTNLIMGYFRQGKIYTFDEAWNKRPLKDTSRSFTVHALFLSYLKIIKELNNDSANILIRDPNTGRIDKEALSKNVSKDALLIDGRGGFISNSLKGRSTYYLYRSLFLQSLWCLSIKLKAQLFFSDNDRTKQ